MNTVPTVSSSALQRDIGPTIARVQSGETLQVERRGVPVARLVPVDVDERREMELAQLWEQVGRLVQASGATWPAGHTLTADQMVYFSEPAVTRIAANVENVASLRQQVIRLLVAIAGDVDDPTEDLSAAVDRAVRLAVSARHSATIGGGA